MSDANQPIESMQTDEDRFVNMLTLPNLQDIASYQIALSIWHEYLSHSKIRAPNEEIQCYGGVIDQLDLDFCYEKDTDKLIESLGTPRIIDEKLKNCLDEVREETRSWIRRFTYNLFSTNLMHYSIRGFDPDCCVWLPNGKIDYKRTAIKMLTGRGISQVQKFAIMSEYCLFDEVEGFDILTVSKIFLKEVNFGDDCLIYYWICRIRNELHKVPLNGFNSTDAAMAAKCGENRWIAFEYFWNRLGIDDQISVAQFWLNPSQNPYSIYPQARLLSKMSWHQQSILLSDIPEQIILNFCFSDTPQSALWAWKHSKSRMNCERFGKIVKTISQDYTNLNCEEEMILFLEMWDQAGDERRNYVAQNMADDIISQFSSERRLSPAAFKFLSKFLSMKSPEFRRRAMLKIAPHLAPHILYPGMKEIIDLCLLTDDDRSEFKFSMKYSDTTKLRCINLFNECNLDQLNAIVEFCSDDANDAQAFKTLLLKSRAIIIDPYVTDIKKWNKFSEFVDNIFPNNPSWALKTKQQFVSNFSQRPGWNRLHCLDSVMKIVGMMFTGDHLKTVKKLFLHSFHQVLSCQVYWWHDAILDEENFQKFIKWCSDDDEKIITDFRKSLNVDKLFDKIIFTLDKRCSLGGEGFNESLIADIDVYLRWCLNSDEKVKKYKSYRINAIMSIDDLEIFKFLNKRNNRSSLNTLFKWLFGDDEEAIRKFKMEKLGIPTE